MGLLNRFTSRLGAAAGATLGLQSSKGDLDRMNVVAMLRREFARFRGQTGNKQTVGALRVFLSRYGVDLPADADDSLKLSDEDRDQFLHAAAKIMLAAGVVTGLE